MTTFTDEPKPKSFWCRAVDCPNDAEWECPQCQWSYCGEHFDESGTCVFCRADNEGGYK